MNEYTIKNVVKKIYSINYDNIDLENNTELIISKRVNDFHHLLYMNNEITNTHLIPHFESEFKSIQTGLFYKDNSIYNHHSYGQPTVSFRLSLTGIKQRAFYRIRFICSRVDMFSEGDSSRVYIVLNGKDIIFNKNISDGDTNIEYIYLSDATVLNVAVTIGKIAIKDIIFEEVEVKEKIREKNNIVELPDLFNLKEYAVFKPSMLIDKDKVMTKYPLLRGIGLNILHNRNNNSVIVERNKENDVIQENIGIVKFNIDIKVVNGVDVTEHTVSDGIAPFSGAGGFSTFKLGQYRDDTRVYVLIYELL